MELANQSHRPSVFEYSDYRCFLEDLYAYLKTRYSYFSYRYFSRRAKFSSPNFLKLVISGKRNISSDSITRFTEALNLSKREARYFEHLVYFNQAKDTATKAECAKQLVLFRGAQKARPLQQAEFSYYAKWYYIPVREAVVLSGFVCTPQNIAAKVFPSISLEEAEAALRDLETLGLLKRDSEGRLIQSDPTLTTANEVTSTAIASYHKEMLQKAADSIDQVPRDLREISAACVPVSKETAAKIKELIQNFRQDILSLAAEDEKPQLIYQLNIQLFPMSQWESSEEKS